MPFAVSLRHKGGFPARIGSLIDPGASNIMIPPVIYSFCACPHIMYCLNLNLSLKPLETHLVRAAMVATSFLLLPPRQTRHPAQQPRGQTCRAGLVAGVVPLPLLPLLLTVVLPRPPVLAGVALGRVGTWSTLARVGGIGSSWRVGWSTTRVGKLGRRVGGLLCWRLGRVGTASRCWRLGRVGTACRGWRVCQGGGMTC